MRVPARGSDPAQTGLHWYATLVFIIRFSLNELSKEGLSFILASVSLKEFLS